MRGGVRTGRWSGLVLLGVALVLAVVTSFAIPAHRPMDGGVPSVPGFGHGGHFPSSSRLVDQVSGTTYGAMPESFSQSPRTRGRGWNR